MNRIVTILILTILYIHQGIGQDYISNLQIEQAGNKIYVRYDLEDIRDDQYYQVYMRSKSMISGRELDAYAVTGDIDRVRSGGEKTIVWEVLDDISRLRGNVKIDVQADLYGINEEASTSSDISTTNMVGQEETVGDYFTDPRDGEVYKTVRIGDQVWMAENLRYKARGSKLNPDNPSKEYGRLYDWATVMDIGKKYNEKEWGGSGEAHQGICPRGWHLPTDEEWKELEISLGLSAEKANKSRYRGFHGVEMKSVTGWQAYRGESGNRTNSSGFNVFPAGHYDSGSFNYLGINTGFWSATEYYEYYATDAWGRALHYGHAGVVRSNYDRTLGLSCRCLQD